MHHKWFVRNRAYRQAGMGTMKFELFPVEISLQYFISYNYSTIGRKQKMLCIRLY
ncbi:MAG: hypothetical protein MK226_06955 [Saprospiraceae bacterium]|nr:hypothetical protein [Saprospiraceae bacterium]